MLNNIHISADPHFPSGHESSATPLVVTGVTFRFTTWSESGIMEIGTKSDEPTMKHPVQDIDYTTLSPTERLILVQDILDSVVAQASGDVISPDQIIEIERRAASLADGTLECVPWERVRSRVLGLS
jgi:putative addiction module component (TIGR02574 family)